MILISVKSEVVEDKRQFKSDSAALRFLKRINKLHNSHRLAIVGKKPKKSDFKSQGKYLKAIEEYEEALSCTLKLKVEIINTKANQLNLSI